MEYLGWFGYLNRLGKYNNNIIEFIPSHFKPTGKNTLPVPPWAFNSFRPPTSSEFLRPSVGRVWIFSGTTHLIN